jgi:hypothetical protein
VDPYPRGSDWMPITPKTGSLFHADSHPIPRIILSTQGNHAINIKTSAPSADFFSSRLILLCHKHLR